jgi:uncharacterized protein (DUF2267 family)
MHPNTIELFSETIAKTGEWLDDIMLATGKMEIRHAYSVLRAVLHVLRDRLTPEEAVDLGAQLPTLVRGFYFEGWTPARRPMKYRHKAEFLRQVAQAVPSLPEANLERAVQAVFSVLAKRVSGGEIRHVHNQLPPELRELWDEAA